VGVGESTGEGPGAGQWPGRALRSLFVPPPGTFPSLDALRTAAIVLVIGNHLAVGGSELVPSSSWSLVLFRYGWTGVDLFFVLSGFFIGRQLQRELQRTGTVQVPRFLLRRGLRIWPLYFAWVAFVALALGKRHGLWPDLVFLSNYAQGQVSGGWSLSTEEQFYLIVPLLLLAVQRLLGRRGQAWVPLGLLALMPVVRAVTLHGAGEARFDRIYGPIHTHCDGLLVGLFLAWASVKHPHSLSPKHPTRGGGRSSPSPADLPCGSSIGSCSASPASRWSTGGWWPSGSGPARESAISPPGAGSTCSPGCRSGCTSTTSKCSPGSSRR